MVEIFKKSRIAIVGGGRVCKDILKIILNPDFSYLETEITGVADLDENAKGLAYAKKRKIFTTSDYLDLFDHSSFDILIELTGNNDFLQILRRQKPHGVRLIDHFEAVSLWDFLQIANKKLTHRKSLKKTLAEEFHLKDDVIASVESKFTEFSKDLAGIISDRTRHIQAVEKKLVRRERILSQIIQGSAVPVFVIDTNHNVTHWNKALEMLTGHTASDLIGTRDHWKAFYSEDQPCMADFVVDGISRKRIERYYGKRLRPLTFLKGAYQAEDFFPTLGVSGRWLYFTAAPIRTIDGRIQGAIETLWDVTEERQAKQMLENLVALEKSILDAIPTAVLVLRRRKIEFANDAVEPVFGWKPDELIGKSTRILYRNNSEYNEIGELFYGALAKNRSFGYEFPCVKKSGREILCSMRSARIGDELKEQSVVVAYEDITERTKAEKELVKREKTLSEIIQGISIPAFVIDREHTVIHWNRALERLTGYKAHEIIGTSRHWEAFYTGEKPILADLIVDKADFNEIKRYYGDKGKISQFIEGAYEAENFFPRMGRKGRWLYITAAPIKGADGTVEGAIETFWDITASKLLHTEREKHIRQLIALWEITSALSATLDLDETLNAALTSIVGHLDLDSAGVYLKEKGDLFQVASSIGYAQSFYQKGSTVRSDGIVGETARKREIVFLEDVKLANTPYKEFAMNEGLKSAAYIPLISNKGVFGVMRVSSHTASRFSEQDKNVLSIIGNHLSLQIENARLHHETKMFGKSLEIKVKEKTRELQASYHSLRSSEEKYRTLFDADPSPIFIFDRHTLQILDVNATAVDCYGYARTDFLDMTFADLSNTPDREFADMLRKIKFNESRFYPKKIHKKGNGSFFYVDVHVSSIRFTERECLIATTPDITENVRKETQLIQASKMATLGTMASGIAHEISQPLNVIQVCADYFIKTLKKGDKINDQDLWVMCEEIKKNVDRAARTIKHMKDFSRQSEVSSDRISINKPITDVFKILGQQLRVHQIEINLDLDDKIPCINADHNRMEQVFINLVTNAMDALDEKKGKYKKSDDPKKISIRSFAENERVVVTVSDNGTGIPEKVKEKIFEPFFTTKSVGKGTGLGMSISYGIITDYNGTIEVESTEGAGTAFRLSFPAIL
ncbi:MAG: PAS domain S-box protein [Syntrophales bacterium]|jgi:PAS domain S-box-containing protein|nr:PAS domain S-box protein [Syntrophales bacterium]MDY0043274.1 PAS domain S-box protein [Syntrophales bacterium]